MRLEIAGRTVSCSYWDDGLPKWLNVEIASTADGQRQQVSLQTASIAEIRTLGQMLVNFADECERKATTS